MSDYDLRYRNDVQTVAELGVDECIVINMSGQWHMGWRFVRMTDGKTETRYVPVTPNGDPQPIKDNWGTWGLKRAGQNRWEIIPSIKCIETRKNDKGEYEDVETWHKNPALTNVPDGEPWQ